MRPVRPLALLPATALLLALGAPGATAPASAQEVCADVHVLASRGSGQPVAPESRTYDGMNPRPLYGFGPELSFLHRVIAPAAQAAGHTVKPIANPYVSASVSVLAPSTAVKAALASAALPQAPTAAAAKLGLASALYARESVVPYQASINSGRDWLVKQARDRVAACRDTRLVLLGYSQGAIVVHQALKVLRDTAPQVFDNVDASVLLADGDRVPTTRAVRFGDAVNASGVRTWTKAVRATDVVTPTRVADVCGKGDLVCDTSATTLRAASAGAAVHTTYRTRRPDWLRRAGAWAAGLLRVPEQPTPEPTPTPTPTTPPVSPFPTRPGDVASPYLGAWSGTVTQGGWQTYPVLLTLEGGPTGTVVGRSSYPTLVCDGTLTLRRADAAEVVVAEDVPSSSNCFDTDLVLRLVGTELHYSFAGFGDGTAVLRRLWGPTG